MDATAKPANALIVSAPAKNPSLKRHLRRTPLCVRQSEKLLLVIAANVISASLSRDLSVVAIALFRCE
jgi:hypothetical protein